MTEHKCVFRRVIVWSEWKQIIEFREREGRRVNRCQECGRLQPSRRARPAAFVEREWIETRPPIAERVVREAAYRVLRAFRRRAADAVSSQPIKLRGLSSALRREGMRGSDTDRAFGVIVEAGLLRGRFRLRGSGRILESVTVIAPDSLEDFARPGARTARLDAARMALASLTQLAHPIAEVVRSVLADSNQLMRMSPALVRALGAVASHAASGDAMSERVFSTHYLGGSKELRRVRSRVERVVGPLEQLGIREGAVLQLLGGHGALVVGRTRVDLVELGPFAGLTRERISSADFVFPDEGLLVVENLAVFDACCRGEVEGAGHSMIVWSAGYPGYGVRRVVEAASRAGAQVRIWSDLDLDGVRITRLLASWSPSTAQPWRMSPSDFDAAAVKRRLGPRFRAAIAAELDAHPDGLLVDLLKKIVSEEAWVEQEVFLRR